MLGEGRAEAAAHAAAERDPGIGGGRVLEEALGPERVRLRIAVRARVREPDRRRDVRPRRQHVTVHAQLGGQAAAGQRDDRPQAERLRDDGTDVGVAAGVDLGHEPVEHARMAQQQVERPGERRRRGLVPREQERHELVADLAVVHPAAILEARADQQREDVLARVGAARRDLLGEQDVDLVRRARAAGRADPVRRRVVRGARRTAGRATPCPRAIAPRRPASRSRRSGSATPNTARRITSSVTDCMCGWIANGCPTGQRSTSRATASRTIASYERMRSPWNGGSISRRRARWSRPSSRSSERAPDDRPQRDRAPGRQPVLRDGVERPDRVRLREHHHRRLEAEEAHAERVAEAAPAGLEERDRPQQPAGRLDDGRCGRAGRQRAHASDRRLGACTRKSR